METLSSDGAETAPDAASPVVIGHPAGPEQPVDENPPGETGDATELYYPGIAFRTLDFAPALAPLSVAEQPSVPGVGRDLVYTAVVEDREAPASPFYGVTVRIPAPRPGGPTLGDPESFLRQLEADFLLRRPFGVDAAASGDENPESGLGSAAQAVAGDELAAADGPDVVDDGQEADDGAVVEIELALLQVDDPDATYGVVAAFTGTIQPGFSHIFVARGGSRCRRR